MNLIIKSVILLVKQIEAYMLNGVGTNISMAYTSNYNKKSTGDKMDIEFEIEIVSKIP